MMRSFFLALLVLYSLSLPVQAASPPVDYLRDIHPLLQTRCGACHLNGSKMGGLQLDSRALLLHGGTSGPDVVPGHSTQSRLIRLVSGQIPGEIMPAQGPRLTAVEINLLKNWIDQGASFGRTGAGLIIFPTAPLRPRRPTIPPGPAGANPIDRILAVYYRSHNVHPGPIVDDRLYARRVYLDLLGLTPTSDQVESFASDRRPDKRERLARQLLSNDPDYAAHWLSFWNDALRNDYAGTGYIDGGRASITRWLYRSLLTNKPYDRFVTELINPTTESEGFVKGIIWRGTVNASQTPEMQAAQNISQVFLGINLKCASCHDSFISNWKLSDSYGMAGIYADHPLELVRCDHPMGVIAPIKFLYPEMGSIPADAPRSERLQKLASILTAPSDGRLNRTIVNRIWARLLGRGLVEPQDEMDNPPWSQDLLDWLAIDLSDHHQDLKQTLLRIVTSQAYQLAAAPDPSERNAHFIFTGPGVRRLSAEQFVDAVWRVTGAAPERLDAELGGPSVPVAAHWVWNDAKGISGVPGGHFFLRKTLNLPSLPDSAYAVMSCDNECALWVNGKRVAASQDWMKPAAVDLKRFLQPGENTLVAEAINWPDKELGKGLDVTGDSPAGFIFYARIRKGALSWDTASDSSWMCTPQMPGNDEKSEGRPAVELADSAAGPWNLGSGLAMALGQVMEGSIHVRASLVKADALTTALGRPNRDQVVTSRSTAATTLQALELTNGRILAGWLDSGAHQWIAETARPGLLPDDHARAIVNSLFRELLLRDPSAAERQAAMGTVGSPPTPEGVSDLLWALLMMPEFQLIR